MCNSGGTEKLILDLEEKLLNPKVRCSKEELEKMLNEEVFKFCM